MRSKLVHCETLPVRQEMLKQEQLAGIWGGQSVGRGLPSNSSSPPNPADMQMDATDRPFETDDVRNTFEIPTGGGPGYIFDTGIVKTAYDEVKAGLNEIWNGVKKTGRELEELLESVPEAATLLCDPNTWRRLSGAP